MPRPRGKSVRVVSVSPVTLATERLRISIDPGRGADILSILDLVTDVELLFSTPWRGQADAIRAGAAPQYAGDSAQAWLEQYRGGWQTLCPNAGPPREYLGAKLGFHGEASTVEWKLEHLDDTSAELSVDLFTVPLRIRRHLSVDGGSVEVVDELTNVSDRPLTVDYSHHPALGGAFLGDECEVSTNATMFTPDTTSDAPPFRWDEVGSRMSALPGPEGQMHEFGWLSGFPTDGAWAAVTNPTLGVTARLTWDPRLLPHAWWWQEFNSTHEFPWFGKARVFAIEPASTPTSGPGRAGGVNVASRATVSIPVRLTVEHSVA